MAKIMDPILPILSILGYWAIILGSFGGPGSSSTAAQISAEHVSGLHGRCVPRSPGAEKSYR